MLRRSGLILIALGGMLLVQNVLLQNHAAAAPDGSRRTVLWNTARRALERNRVSIGSRRMLTAGQYQFHSMWTRDFSYAARGLLALGDHATVRDQIDALLEHASPEGLVPRALDTMPIGKRVVGGMIRARLGLGPSKHKANPTKLYAQVLDEHGSPSLDSNLLVLKTALDYVKASGDQAWLARNQGKLMTLYRYYQKWRGEDGLLEQPRYADWQDSVRREGKSFYLNLLYLDVTRRLGDESGLDAGQRAALADRVHETFFDRERGLYRSLAGKDFISLDGNLLALDLGFVDARSERGRSLYDAMKRSPLWTRGGVPGSNTFGDYPKSWLHLPARLAGLRHYHDRMHWSWLTALSAKVAHQVGDGAESARIVGALAALAERDGTIAEIYQEKKQGLRPFRSLTYRSEAPFSWGAGMVLDALKATE